MVKQMAGWDLENEYVSVRVCEDVGARVCLWAYSTYCLL